ncbi:MAG: hypothetical protein HOQ05_01675 [Corynebacteriales bacterium]|nr:hypothetical protein [Mycobacteriales bacterium]
MAISPRRIVAVVIAAGVLALGAAACSTESDAGKSTCNAEKCTVTLNRGVDAKMEVLGVDVRLDEVKGDNVTVEIAGQKVTVPHGQETEAEGFNIKVKEIDDDEVVLEIATGITGG